MEKIGGDENIGKEWSISPNQSKDNHIRHDSPLTKAYEKNASTEYFLRKLNSILWTHHEGDLDATLEEIYPTMFVLGVPRSGSTLVSQLLASSLFVGYPDNIVARFWLSPVYGLRLSKIFLNGQREWSFNSDYGRTTNLADPHEFGYFWFYHLRLKENKAPDPETYYSVDWEKILTLIKNMAAANESAMMFKSLQMGWYANECGKHFKKAYFILIERDPIDNAISLLRMREKKIGSKDSWASMKPRIYEKLKEFDVHTQVAGQVYWLKKEFAEQLSLVDPDRVIRVSYQEVCDNPHNFLQYIAKATGARLRKEFFERHLPSSFVPNTYKMDTEDRQKIEFAWKSLFNLNFK